MALYPSLEDMKVDQLMKAQLQAETQYPSISPNSIAQPAAPSAPPLLSPSQVGGPGALYPLLGEYMGLEINEDAIAQSLPEYAIINRESFEMAIPAQSGPLAGLTAPVSSQSLSLQKAIVTNGIRELTLCKDQNGKIGIRVHSVNNGVFICLVTKGSPAALVGLRFGDQILDINGVSVAGYSMDQVHKIFRNSPVNGIKVVVRDRPFERTVTMHKDSTGHIGFQFKNGKVTALVKDSSASRNGLLTDHQILEINGKNVIGLKDKDITIEIESAGDIITVTVIPSFIYDHMIKKMSGSLLRNIMDHSDPML
ncbi:syntenin-1-like [Leptopilina heterotoma]|uniref:syntenin-1-like n=1 Tax=Leptopilina heterotoma TaxID=63436 RepID=UPI001CA7F388|nr:syntenin-1-like [Leptopilina heterotoma]XP_043480960.1 syntenin-1-like [Leptopilina heterotoma]